MDTARDAVYAVAAALAVPILLQKKRRGWAGRFGRIDEQMPEKPRVLLHAVSVGEVNLLRRVVPVLRERGVGVVVSATTDTGFQRAKTLYAGQAAVVRYPMDFSWCVRRFLGRVDPDVVGLVELELWPNFAAACTRRRVPLAVLNGRISGRSFGRYKKILPLVRGGFARLASVCAQDERSAERFVGLGVPHDRCAVAGSMKWDAAGSETDNDRKAAAALAQRMGIDTGAPLVVAGSTAPEEHGLLRDAAPDGVQLLCAPRRPEWFDGAADALPGCARWSQGGATGNGQGRGGRFFLLDTIGALRTAYVLADVVVIGRSFGDLYGSDPMEPAALGKPVVVGPAVDDFRTVVDAMQQAGALVRTSKKEIGAVLEDLCSDRNRCETIGARAMACVQEHSGASVRNAEMLLGLLSRRSNQTIRPVGLIATTT